MPEHIRYAMYDLHNNIFWRNISTPEVTALNRWRAEEGLLPLQFVEPPTEAIQAVQDSADIARSVQALRDALNMPYDGTPASMFDQVLAEAVRRLTTAPWWAEPVRLLAESIDQEVLVQVARQHGIALTCDASET
jgi:hypothetical protein